jgi:hypothetical protein
MMMLVVTIGWRWPFQHQIITNFYFTLHAVRHIQEPGCFLMACAVRRRIGYPISQVLLSLANAMHIGQRARATLVLAALARGFSAMSS